MPPSWRRRLLPRPDIHQDETHAYDYLSELTTDIGTKWENQFARFHHEVLQPFKIDLAGKRILDVSGGPGFFGRDMSKIAARVVMTEFNQPTVDFARTTLGLEALTYDFNKHDLRSLTTEVFDIVMVRYALNFCLDLNKFLREIRSLMAPDGLVMVSGFIPPSLAVSVRAQFDDYAYPVLYNPETVEKLFLANGFVLRSRYREASFHYNTGLRLPLAIVNWIYFWMNRLRVMPSFNRDSQQKNLGMMFALSTSVAPPA